MGGPGSGRIGLYNGKITTEDVCSFSIKQLASKGLFSGKSTAKVDLIRYNEPHDKILIHSWQTCISPVCCKETKNTFSIDLHGSIDIERTPCNFGGTRPWFKCPRCNERVSTMFIIKMRQYGEVVGKAACRTCHKLPYASQLEGDFDLACRRVRTIQRQLGNPSWYNTIDRWFPRPKGMHKKTYLRKLQKAGIATSDMDSEYKRKFDL